MDPASEMVADDTLRAAVRLRAQDAVQGVALSVAVLTVKEAGPVLRLRLEWPFNGQERGRRTLQRHTAVVELTARDSDA